MNIQKHFDRFAERIERDMLPDVCQIQWVNEDNFIYELGVKTEIEPIYRMYKGSRDIPCRVDESRAFRPAEVRQQATEIFEYYLQLPKDVDVAASDRVIINNNKFVIRKLQDASNWDATKQALIHRLTQDVVN